ncbi:MAG: DUF4031 domain-containing protein [Rhodospirillaceae bacterium]
MSVYVDPAANKFGRMLMCHMWADSEAEMHAMADHIGVARKHFQSPPNASWHHYDICKAKRALAVAAGAIEMDRFAALEHTAKLKGNDALLARIAMLREQREGGGGHD